MTLQQQRLLWYAVLVLAGTGATISAYLTVTHWTDRPVICAGLGSCATVQSSEYARVAGVPVALLGLGMYLVLGGTAMAALARPGAALVAFGFSLTGTIYSAYLTWVELAVLDAICLWCVASALVVTAIAALAALAVLLPHPLRQRPEAGRLG